MVLRLLALVTLLGALAGCHQSLFDANNGGGGDGGGGNGDGMIASTCPMPCLGDAGGEFGTSANWRYLDDHRNRTWTAMTKSGSTYTGANPMNKITSCASNGGAAACGALPGALLVTSAGATATEDPAIEWKAFDNRVIQLQIGVFVPSGKPSQQVRVYRNSREDVLFTGSADPGTTLSQVIKVDALAGDRFLLSIAPIANGAADVGVQMFVVADGAAFPSNCQVAVPFSSAMANMVHNVCATGDFTSQDYSTGNPTAPTLTTGPYGEQGMAAMLAQDKYFDSPSALPRPGDFTVQMWIRHDMLVDNVTGAWPFSDEDLDAGGGIGIVIYDNGGTLAISADTCTDPMALTFDDITGSWPGDKQWHFLRIVHNADILSMCVDGMRQVMKSMPRSFKSTHAAYIGKNVVWTPAGAFFIGAIDDVRVFNTALPCN